MLKRRKKSLSEYSTGELVMFRFRKNKLAMFGVFLLAFVFLAVLAAPILSSYENVTKLHISDRFTSPNPLVVFPWGSMSTSNTRFPLRARQAPRLIFVVVFPTPPF